jgi:hypothetical protein
MAAGGGRGGVTRWFRMVQLWWTWSLVGIRCCRTSENERRVDEEHVSGNPVDLRGSLEEIRLRIRMPHRSEHGMTSVSRSTRVWPTLGACRL